MELNMPTFPFEVSLDVILQDPESYVDAVFSCLESEFLVLPKGARLRGPPRRHEEDDPCNQGQGVYS